MKVKCLETNCLGKMCLDLNLERWVKLLKCDVSGERMAARSVHLWARMGVCNLVAPLWACEITSARGDLTSSDG